MIFECSTYRNGNWPQLKGLGLSTMKDIRELNVYDMDLYLL